MLKVNGRSRMAGLCMLTLLLPLSIFFSFQTPAYSQCGIDWECQTVDSAEDVGRYTSLAFGSGPAISYYDYTNGDLKFAHDRNNDGDFTDPEEMITVDSAGRVGSHTSLAFGSGPAISYWDYTNGDLKFAYDRNNDGDFEDPDEIITVDSAGSVGTYTSLAFGSGPAISYLDNTNGDLKFAYDRNNDGDFEDPDEIITIDSIGDMGRPTSLAFGSGPAISYWDFTNKDLKFAYDRNNDGDFSDPEEMITVDSAEDVGRYTSLAFGSGPAISYYDATNSDLKFAHDRNNDGDFTDPEEIITVDSAGSVGGYTSLAFGSGPAISYCDGSYSDLKFAYDRNNDGDFEDAEEIITVDSAGVVGVDTSLAFDASGKPAISYYDDDNGDLKFARYSPQDVRLEVGDATLSVGESASVDIWVRNFPAAGFGLTSYDIRINYDPAMIQVTGVSGGDGIFGSPEYDIYSNYVSISDWVIAMFYPTGDIRIADLEFTCLGDGVTPLSPTNIHLYDQLGEVYATPQDGIITQVEPTPPDTTPPTLNSIIWIDVDGSGTINAGDILRFAFSEAMDSDTITAANIDARLPTSPSHTYGTLAAADLSWNTAQTELAVTLGAGSTISVGDTVNPWDAVTDVAGNPDNTLAPGPAIPFTPTLTHTWTFHAAGFFPKHLPDAYTGQVVLAGLNIASIPDEVQGVWWYDGAALDYKFWVPGVGGDLTTLTGQSYNYMVLVTGACEWEIPLP